ncbi:hypothetical protein BgiBS90_013748, partial [Biomphalaria glabrata]
DRTDEPKAKKQDLLQKRLKTITKSASLRSQGADTEQQLKTITKSASIRSEGADTESLTSLAKMAGIYYFPPEETPV